MNLTRAAREVKDWNLKFQHIPADDDERESQWRGDLEFRRLAFNLVEEEVNELAEATLQDENGNTLVYEELPLSRDIPTLDAIADILFTVFGLAAKAGLEDLVEPAFVEVLKSNWSKLGEDGEPVFYPSGKVAKSDRYREPNLEQFFDEEYL